MQKKVIIVSLPNYFTESIIIIGFAKYSNGTYHTFSIPITNSFSITTMLLPRHTFPLLSGAHTLIPLQL